MKRKNFKRKEVVYIYLNDWTPPDDPAYNEVLKLIKDDEPIKHPDQCKVPFNYSMATYDMSMCYFITTTPEDLEKYGWLSLLKEVDGPEVPWGIYPAYNPDGTPTGIWPPYDPQHPGFWLDGPKIDEIETGHWDPVKGWEMGVGYPTDSDVVG